MRFMFNRPSTNLTLHQHVSDQCAAVEFDFDEGVNNDENYLEEEEGEGEYMQTSEEANLVDSDEELNDEKNATQLRKMQEQFSNHNHFEKSYSPFEYNDQKQSLNMNHRRVISFQMTNRNIEKIIQSTPKK